MGIDFSKFSQEIQSKIKAALEDTKSPDKIDAAELRAMNLEKDIANKLMQELCGNRDFLGDGYFTMQNENKVLVLLDKPENNSFVPLTKDSLDYYNVKYYGLDIAQGVYKEGMVYLADSKGRLVKDRNNNYICERVSVQEYAEEADDVSGTFETIENEPAERTNRRFAIALVRSMYMEVIGELKTVLSQMGALDVGFWREALGMGVQAIADLKENQQMITATTMKKIERIEAERDSICDTLGDLIDSPAEFEEKFYRLVGKEYRDNAFEELRGIQHNQENKASKTKFKECVAKFKELYPENNVSKNIDVWENSVEFQKTVDEIANIVVMLYMTGGIGKVLQGSVQTMAKNILLAAAKGDKKAVMANFAKLAPEVQSVWKSLAKGEFGVATAQVVAPMAQSSATMGSWEGIKAFINNLTNAEQMPPKELLQRTLDGFLSGAEMGVVMGGLETFAIAPAMLKLAPVLGKLSGTASEISGLMAKGDGVVSMEKIMATYTKASEALKGKIAKEGAHTIIALPVLTVGFTVEETAFHYDEAEFRKALLDAATTEEEREAIRKMNPIDLRLEFAKTDFISQVKGMATIEGVGLMFRRLQAGRIAAKSMNQHQKDILGANLREVKENGKTFYELCTPEGEVIPVKDGNYTITKFSSVEKATAAYSVLCVSVYSEINALINDADAKKVVTKVEGADSRDIAAEIKANQETPQIQTYQEITYDEAIATINEKIQSNSNVSDLMPFLKAVQEKYPREFRIDKYGNLNFYDGDSKTFYSLSFDGQGNITKFSKKNYKSENDSKKDEQFYIYDKSGKQKEVSRDDYHKTWSVIRTSELRNYIITNPDLLPKETRELLLQDENHYYTKEDIDELSSMLKTPDNIAIVNKLLDTRGNENRAIRAIGDALNLSQQKFGVRDIIKVLKSQDARAYVLDKIAQNKYAKKTELELLLKGETFSALVEHNFVDEVNTSYRTKDITLDKVGDVITEYQTNSQIKERINQQVPDGEAACINGKMYCRADNTLVPIQLEKATFNKLFPVEERYNIQQGKIGDCYFIAELGGYAATPNGRAALYSSFRQEGNDIIIKFPRFDNIEIKFKNGDLNKLYPVSLYKRYGQWQVGSGNAHVKACDGIKMIEQAYSFVRNNHTDENVQIVANDKFLMNKQMQELDGSRMGGGAGEVPGLFGNYECLTAYTSLGFVLDGARTVEEGLDVLAKELKTDLNVFGSVSFSEEVPIDVNDGLLRNHQYRIVGYEKNKQIVKMVNPHDSSKYMEIPLELFKAAEPSFSVFKINPPKVEGVNKSVETEETKLQNPASILDGAKSSESARTNTSQKAKYNEVIPDITAAETMSDAEFNTLLAELKTNPKYPKNDFINRRYTYVTKNNILFVQRLLNCKELTEKLNAEQLRDIINCSRWNIKDTEIKTGLLEKLQNNTDLLNNQYIAQYINKIFKGTTSVESLKLVDMFFAKPELLAKINQFDSDNISKILDTANNDYSINFMETILKHPELLDNNKLSNSLYVIIAKTEFEAKNETKFKLFNEFIKDSQNLSNTSLVTAFAGSFQSGLHKVYDFDKKLENNDNKYSPEELKTIELNREKSLRTDIFENIFLELSNNKEFSDVSSRFFELYLENEFTEYPEVDAKRFREMCEAINKEYGVKVILPSNLKEVGQSLILVYQELNNYKMHSNNQAKMPPVLDFMTPLAENIGGMAHIIERTNHIDIRELSISIIKHALRHEMAHINDTKQLRNFPEEIRTFNKTPEIDPYTGIPEFDYKTDLNLDNCKYVNELRNGGITEGGIRYAYKNPLEFIAVASQGDFSKYSAEFKEYLVSLGMPEWMLNFKNLNPYFISREGRQFKGKYNRLLTEYDKIGNKIFEVKPKDVAENPEIKTVQYKYPKVDETLLSKIKNAEFPKVGTAKRDEIKKSYHFYAKNNNGERILEDNHFFVKDKTNERIIRECILDSGNPQNNVEKFYSYSEDGKSTTSLTVGANGKIISVEHIFYDSATGHKVKVEYSSSEKIKVTSLGKTEELNLAEFSKRFGLSLDYYNLIDRTKIDTTKAEPDKPAENVNSKYTNTETTPVADKSKVILTEKDRFTGIYSDGMSHRLNLSKYFIDGIFKLEFEAHNEKGEIVDKIIEHDWFYNEEENVLEIKEHKTGKLLLRTEAADEYLDLFANLQSACKKGKISEEHLITYISETMPIEKLKIILHSVSFYESLLPSEQEILFTLLTSYKTGSRKFMTYNVQKADGTIEKTKTAWGLRKRLNELMDKCVIPEDIVVTRYESNLGFFDSISLDDNGTSIGDAIRYLEGKAPEEIQKYIADNLYLVHERKDLTSSSLNTSTHYFDRKKVQLNIKVSKGSKGIYLEDIRDQNKGSYESELLLKMEQAYKITNVRFENGKTIIDVELISKDIYDMYLKQKKLYNKNKG